MTKELILSQGLITLVDDDVYEWASQFKWSANKQRNTFYARRNSWAEKKYPLLHREILNAPASMQVDHINGDGLDNRRSNLRLVTHTENLWNRGLNSNNTSGYKGVSIYRKSNQWRASIRINRTFVSLGLFDSPIEAALVYDKAARKYFREFAKTNFPEVK